MSEKMAIEQRVEREITARMEELDQKLVAEKLERYRRLNQFAQLGKVLFVGSSLMEQFPINELLLDMGRTYTVYNRGMGGYTTQQLAKSLDVCVYQLQPSQVLINIGTNDMNTPEYTVEGLMERYEAILRDIQAHVPGVKLTLLAYYPLCEPKLAEEPHGREILKSRTIEPLPRQIKLCRHWQRRLGPVSSTATAPSPMKAATCVPNTPSKECTCTATATPRC